MWFDGSDDYVKCPAVAINPTFSITASALVNTFLETGYQHIISARNDGYAPFWQLLLHHRYKKIGFYNPITGMTKSVVILSLNQTYHIGVVVSPTLTTFVIDDIVNSAASVHGTLSNGNFIRIGYEEANARFWTGMIRHVTIWDGDYRTNPPKLAEWKGLGVTSADWQDTTGNGHDGTVYGSPERCLVHRRGAVIRTDGSGQRYIVGA